MQPSKTADKYDERNTSTPFLNSVLFPRCEDNVQEGLVAVRQSNLPRDEKRAKILELLKASGLWNSGDRMQHDRVTEYLLDPTFFEYSVKEVIRHAQRDENRQIVKDAYARPGEITVRCIDSIRSDPNSLSEIVRYLEHDFYVESQGVHWIQLHRLARKLLDPEWKHCKTEAVIDGFIRSISPLRPS